MTEAITCPDCAGPVDPDRDRLCPRCGYPLMYLEAEPAPEVAPIGRKPGEYDEATAVLAPAERRTPNVVAEPSHDRPPAAGETRCPNCGQHNAVARIRCERCGHQVRQPRPAPAPAPPPQQLSPRRAIPRWAIGAAAAAVLVLVSATVLVVSKDLWPGSGTTSGTAGVQLTPVDRNIITPTASSTIRNDARFVAKKTLDGDRATAWQCHTARLKGNVGVKLSYTFDRKIQLARITLTNGYAKSPKDFQNNERVKEFAVKTDAGEWNWPVQDNPDPQAMDIEGKESTETVTLVVKDVYLSTAYRDLAVSEVGFEERR